MPLTVAVEKISLQIQAAHQVHEYLSRLCQFSKSRSERKYFQQVCICVLRFSTNTACPYLWKTIIFKTLNEACLPSVALT